MRKHLSYYVRALRKELRRLDAERELEERFPGATLEDGVKVMSPHLLELGDDVLIHRNTLLHCGGMNWSQRRGRIAIGDGSSIGHNSVIWGAGGVDIGRNVHIGVASIIFSSQSYLEQREDGATHWFAEVKIEDDVAIFASTLIVPGVTIGRGALIGAKSLVLKDVAPFEMWAGAPAKKIRDIDQETWKALDRGPAG